MAQQTMYSGLVNSPETTITNNISTTDTIIYVLDPARVPSDLPNLMTLGTGTNAETVLVTAINDNALTVTRGFQGIAKDWLAGTIIARNFTAYDHDTFKNNIKDLNTNKVDNSRVLTNVPTNAKFTDTITPIANNLTETVEGKALDATQGKILDGKIGNLSNSFTSHKAETVQQEGGVHGLEVEEGTFTPSLKFGGNAVGMTYTKQLGRYKKIGNIIDFNIALALSVKGTSVGSASIEGLPFVTAAGNFVFSYSPTFTSITYPADAKAIICRLGGVSSSLLLQYIRDNGVYGTLADTNFANNSQLEICGTYQI